MTESKFWGNFTFQENRAKTRWFSHDFITIKTKAAINPPGVLLSLSNIYTTYEKVLFLIAYA